MKIYRNEEGKRHRTDGPAFEADGSKEWYLNGVLQKSEGAPA